MTDDSAYSYWRLNLVSQNWTSGFTEHLLNVLPVSKSTAAKHWRKHNTAVTKNNGLRVDTEPVKETHTHNNALKLSLKLTTITN